ncbi:MAG TPA: hypothetical protein VFT65_05040 [Candidatus Angelobacter sp.]|nr:hypothetical protein [Candidatus Angelobacter sp.]
MKRNFQFATLLVTAGFLAAGAIAGSQAAVAQSNSPRLYRSGSEWVQEVSGTFSAGKIVRVRSSSGSIRIQGAQQNNITYTIREHVRAVSAESARRELSHMKFTTYSSGETVILRADCEGSNRGSIDFDIQVPNQTQLVKLETDGGSVVAKNLSGRLEATTGAGGIQLDQIAGVVTATSGGGNIEIGKVGSDVQATTGGGSIRLVSAGGQVTANSGGGNLNIGWAKLMTLRTEGGSIHVTKCGGQVKAATGGGNIELIDIAGAAQIETGGGSIHIGPVSGGVRAETGGGAIMAKLAAGGAPFTDSKLETQVGDIVVFVPDGLGLNIRAAVEVARGYGIRSDFGEQLKISSSSKNMGPREVFAEGSLNGGGPVLHVHTTAGNIEFRREVSR